MITNTGIPSNETLDLQRARLIREQNEMMTIDRLEQSLTNERNKYQVGSGERGRKNTDEAMAKILKNFVKLEKANSQKLYEALQQGKLNSFNFGPQALTFHKTQAALFSLTSDHSRHHNELRDDMERLIITMRDLLGSEVRKRRNRPLSDDKIDQLLTEHLNKQKNLRLDRDEQGRLVNADSLAAFQKVLEGPEFDTYLKINPTSSKYPQLREICRSRGYVSYVKRLPPEDAAAELERYNQEGHTRPREEAMKILSSKIEAHNKAMIEAQNSASSSSVISPAINSRQVVQPEYETNSSRSSEDDESRPTVKLRTQSETKSKHSIANKLADIFVGSSPSTPKRRDNDKL
jgi:YD repeat-containing protein